DVVVFFQAEDGIRDRNVTGVQTCALPILSPTGKTPKAWWMSSRTSSKILMPSVACCYRAQILQAKPSEPAGKHSAGKSMTWWLTALCALHRRQQKYAT